MLGPVSTGAARFCQSFGNDLSVGRTGHPMQAGTAPKRIRILPRHLVEGCLGDAIRRQRRTIVPRAAGRVLEIGIGSGRNLPFYDASKVAALIGTGASQVLGDAAAMPFSVTLHAETIVELPLAAGSIDTVVVTGAISRSADPSATLAEIRRVLKRHGRLLFCERSRAPDMRVARWQRRLASAWQRITGGCLDHDVPALLNRHGFVLEAIDAAYLPRRPRMTGFVYWGAATVV